MYINEVIRLAQNYYPSEFNPTDMYIWCNEVSSMITAEDRTTYHEKKLTVASDGTILLPRGVGFENIERITDGVNEYRKDDIRNIASSAISIPSNTESVYVTYSVPYEPIRLVKYRGRAYVYDKAGEISISENEFVPGDTVIMQIAPDTPSSNTISDISVIDIQYNESASELRHTLYVPESAISGNSGDYDDVIITRVVTDKTVCDAPFDSMYVDYVLAKINQYQRDINSYNQHITAFNSRLASYKQWLVDKMPQKDIKFKNWW